MSRNLAFERLRGISAVLVVFIHAPPFIHSSKPSLAFLGWLVSTACLTAVPYFFLLSGWLAASRWPESGPAGADLYRSSNRLLRLYVPWFLVYLALDALVGNPTSWGIVIRRFFAVSDGSADTTGYHLWFLPSLLLAHLLSGVSRRFFASILPCLAFSGLLFAGLAVNDGLQHALPMGIPPNEALNLSLLGFCLGAFLFENQTRLAKFGKPIWIGIACGLLVTESLLWGLFRNWLYVPPFSLSRFLLPAILILYAKENPSFLSSGKLGRVLDYLGKNSTGIYVLHLAFISLVPFEQLVPNGFLRENLVRWLTALVGALLLTALLKRIRTPWVQALTA